MPADAKFCPKCGSPGDSAVNTQAAMPTLGDSTVTPQPGPDGHLKPDGPFVPNDPEPDGALEPDGGHGPDPRRSRRRLMVGLVCAALLLSGTAGLWFFKFRTADEDHYVAQLSKAQLMADFGTADVAVTQGKAFCAKLSAGAPRSGYRSQQIAVANFCNQFSSGFAVVPTPLEQQQNLTKALRQQGLAGQFASDAAAVAHAQSVCRALDNGGPQQGPQEDAVAVSIYCSKYASGFTTLHPIDVEGSFTLQDSTPLDFSPDITG